MRARATMFVASVDTKQFSFVAMDTTELRAKRALMRGWRSHCRQYTGANPDHIGPDDLRVIELVEGECARDGTVITPKPKP